MQASPSPSEPGGGYATRRGHVPQLSISDPSHHVTEAIGHMYEDDYDKRDSRRLSYISSPLSEAITIIPPNLAGCESPTSPQNLQVKNHPNEVNQRQVNGQTWAQGSKSVESSPTSPASTASPGSTDTATTSFPLNDIDYESNPAAVAQELSNLAAIRRMSMDVAATGDPDLPSFSVPSIAPSPSDDENDAARLFWVPARLHPELAPKEFKSFLESKADMIKRKSGEFSTLGSDGEGMRGGLRRKRSMLSRQIDSSHGYTDGAERLERKRSQTQKDSLGPNLHELESLVDDSKSRTPSASSILSDIQKLGLSADEDRPILPPAPPGHSLRRSTRTQYRKAGSLRKGEKAPYSKRAGKSADGNDPTGGQAAIGLTRVSTDPTPSVTRSQALAKSTQATPHTPDTTSSFTSDSASEPTPSVSDSVLPDPSDRASAPPPERQQWHSRISSNGRSTLNIPSSEQRIPEIVETPPPESNATPPSPSSQQQTPPSKSPSAADRSHERPPNKRSGLSRTHATDAAPTLNEFANNPQPLPGNTMRTDSLSFIPTVSEDRKSEERKPEERKSESKKSKDKKESEGGRKSSWHWLLGNEEKDKDKDKKKDKDSDSKKHKSKSADKAHDASHTPPLSSETIQRGRESLVMDRLDPKLEDERRKDNTRRASGESKKEKESGLFSSIFGGSRKKSNGDSGHHHKKSSSRNLSPEPPVRELRPDIDYAWTRFSILEERAIYRMAHIKLANPRRALYSQVLLSNFMYSYLAKVQQMHPHMMLATSAAQRQQQRQQEEYQQYQRYQEAQEQQYTDSSYDDPQMYEYSDEHQDQYRSQSRGSKDGYDNGNAYGPGHSQYGHSTFGDDMQLDDDEDDMW